MSRDEAREKVIPTYMGLIKQIDDQMGVLMGFLEARGLLDTTMIVFTSDHGDYLGDHWMGEKDLFHDASAKIPLIVIDPSAAADATRGTVCDALVEAIDLAPTFIDYFGGKPPDHILEGRSLMPLLRGERPSDWRKVVFSEYDYCMQDVRLKLNQPIEQCRLFMVFDGRWKYIHASGFRPMLYDLLEDPQELTDRGEDSSCADVMARLQAALFDWALHPKGHITTSTEKIAAYAEKQLQVKDGVLIGIWDEAELCGDPEKDRHPAGSKKRSIRDLVARGLDDRLPERGVGGEFLRQSFRRGADRDQADRQQLLLAPRAWRARLPRRHSACLTNSGETAGRQPHPVPGIGDQIDAVLLQGRHIRQERRALRAADGENSRRRRRDAAGSRPQRW